MSINQILEDCLMKSLIFRYCKNWFLFWLKNWMSYLQKQHKNNYNINKKVINNINKKYVSFWIFELFFPEKNFSKNNIFGEVAHFMERNDSLICIWTVIKEEWWLMWGILSRKWKIYYPEKLYFLTFSNSGEYFLSNS